MRPRPPVACGGRGLLIDAQSALESVIRGLARDGGELRLKEHAHQHLSVGLLDSGAGQHLDGGHIIAKFFDVFALCFQAVAERRFAQTQ